MNRADERIAIQNIQGRFAQYYAARRHDLIPSLFSRSASSYCCPDDNVYCGTFQEVSSYFSSIKTEEADSPAGMVVLMNNPIVRIDDETTARGCWTAHCYLIQKTAEGYEIEYGIRRYDADFVLENGDWYYRKLKSFYYISFEPLAFDPALAGPGWIKPDDTMLPPVKETVIASADFIQIQQLAALYCQNRRKGALALFSDQADVCLYLPALMERPAIGSAQIAQALRDLDALEEKNKNYPLHIPMIESPVIEMKADGSAEAAWHVLSHEIKSTAFSHSESYCPMYTKLSLLKGTFRKENGQWKIVKWILDPIFSLPRFHYDKEGSRMCCTEKTAEKWLYMPDLTPCPVEGHEDDLLDIEEMVAWWTACIRHRSFGEIVYQKVAWERPDLIDPRKMAHDIFGLTDAFYIDQPKYPGFHCGTTPYVCLDADTNTAVATWFDYGYTSLGEKFGYTEYPWYANPGIGRYMMRLVKCDGIWKLYEFNWTPIFRIWYQRDFFKFNYTTSKGWVGSASTARFPMPFEDIVYTDERYRPGDPTYRLDPPRISAPNELQIGRTVGFDVVERFSGYTSDRPIPRALKKDAAS